MVILSRDNPLFPYCQFIHRKDGSQLSMLSYDTENGEGVLAGQLKSEYNPDLEFERKVFATDNYGNVLHAHFVDRKNILVKIQIPQTVYLAFKDQIRSIELDPSAKDKVEISYLKEYRPIEEASNNNSTSKAKANP